MLAVDPHLLEYFEKNLDPAHPETGPVPVTILGHGEISTVIGFELPEWDHLVFKRMALFEDDDEIRAYETVYRAYSTALTEIGLQLPDSGIAKVDSEWGPVLYLVQERLEGDTIGHNFVKTASADESLAAIASVLEEIRKVYVHNVSLHRNHGATLGLDAQISNWSIGDSSSQPIYLDTSTPLMRVDGTEQLDVELFLRICPKSMQWLIRRYFLQDVLDRYYDLRLVLTDLLANLFKEQKGSLVPPALELVNEFLEDFSSSPSDSSACDLQPIELTSVKSYYRNDIPIWWLFLNLRKLERLWRTRVTHKPYRPILPGRTRRFHLVFDR